MGTPDAGAFWRVVEEYQVKTLFTAPTAFRAMKQADPKAEMAKRHDLSSLKNLFLAGEHSDPGKTFLGVCLLGFCFCRFL